MPRLVERDLCPHCGARLPRPMPRLCPDCAGALHQRHLKAGCITSAPKLLALGLVLWWWLAHRT